MTLPTFIFILAGVLLNAGAQLLLKAGVAPLGPISVEMSTLGPLMLRVLGQWQIVLGLSFYVLSVGVWIVGLSRVDVSQAYPMLSLGYIVTSVAAYFLLGEPFGTLRFFGIVLILAGVFLIARN
jgi:drug/metabolite transporter (DMT)-like permease